MLTRLDDLEYDLSKLDTIAPVRMVLQYFLEGLPDEYYLGKRMLARESLERDGLVTQIRSRH